MRPIDPTKDYYAILGIDAEATPEEIKGAYRELVRRYHPDSPEGDEEKFRLVQEAYEVLREEPLRRAYDRQRLARGTVRTAPLSCEVMLSRTNVPIMPGPQMLYVLMDIDAHRQGPARKRLPLNLALVIDRSTSMKGTRLDNVKMAAVDLIDYLRPEDRLSIISFSDRARVEYTASGALDKVALRSAVMGLMSGGGTEIYQGLLAGLHEVSAYPTDKYVTYVVLLTDGHTYGDDDKILNLAAMAKSQNVGIIAMGIGEDWNDALLDEVARRSGGVSEYISSPRQIRELLLKRLGDLAGIVLRHVKLKGKMVNYARIHAAFRVLPYMEQLRMQNDQYQEVVFELGDVSEDQPLALLFEWVIEGEQEQGERRLGRFELVGELPDTHEVVSIRRDVNVTFVFHPAAEEVPPRLVNLLARLSVYRLQDQAWKALESGDTQRATKLLESAATRLFDMGYNDLGHIAMLEVQRVKEGDQASSRGRKQVRYGTRSLTIPRKN